MSTTFDGCALQQGFGDNVANAYPGIKGHPGQDTACGYGTTILSSVRGAVCGLYTPEKPASDGFVAVYVLVTTKLETFEFCVGHCSEVFVKLGDFVEVGQPIGKEGNKGLVYYNGILITLAMQKAGDKRGSHRHNQKRPVKAVKKRSAGKRYVENAKGYYKDAKGMYYEYVLPYGDYASCVDFGKPLFPRSLVRGDRGYDVTLLQRAIGNTTDNQTGIFGETTETNLRIYQQSVGITPTGTCGPLTRAYLNAHYGQLEDQEEPTKEKLKKALNEATETVQSLPEGQKTPLLNLLDKLWEAFYSLFQK